MPADNQWLEVDLGSPGAGQLGEPELGAGYAKSFQIQTSNDNNTWTTIYSTTTGTGGNQTSAVNGSGRCVRMYGQTRATTSGFSLYEMQVNGLAAAGLQHGQRRAGQAGHVLVERERDR